MKRFVVLAACVCVSRAQFALPASAPSTQFHAQDEFGQFSFGHAGGPSAKTESRNAYGVTTGSYQYIDANGLLQTVNYVADPLNGFRVAATNLPVAPVAPEVTPLVAPVFDLEGPAPVEDTAEVVAAKAEFQAAFDAAAAAASERKKREADPQVVLGGLGYTGYAGLPYAAALPAALPALAPVGAVPHVPVVKSDVISPAEVSHEVAATPIVSYAHPAFYGKRSADEEAAPAVVAAPTIAGLPYPYAAGLPLNYAAGLPLNYAAAPVAYAAAPAVAAAPSRDAVLTTIKLNPGHATFYRVD